MARGYRDSDALAIDCGMWDNLQEETRINAEKFEMLDTRLVSLEDMFKQMCDALRKCGVEGMPDRSLCYTCRLNHSCSKSTLREGVSTRVTGCAEYIPMKKEQLK